MRVIEMDILSLKFELYLAVEEKKTSL